MKKCATAAALALAALAEHLPRPDDDVEESKPDPAEAEARRRGIKLRDELVDALIPVLKDPDIQVRWAGAWPLVSSLLVNDACQF